MAVWILEMVEPEGARSRISRSLLVSRLGHRAGGATAGARAHAGRGVGLPETAGVQFRFDRAERAGIEKIPA